MIKKLIIVLIIILATAFTIRYLLTNKNVNTSNVLIDAMNSKREVLLDGNKTLFKDIHIVENDYAIPDKYTFIDLDNDNIEEIVVLTTSYYGEYVILRYNNKEVYAYPLGYRSMEILNKDGSFLGSGGAAVSSYCKMKFTNNKMEITEEAYSDSTSNEYKINDKDVSKEEIEAYITQWNNKEEVEWKNYEEEK